MEKSSLLKFSLGFFVLLAMIFGIVNDTIGQNQHNTKYKVINGIEFRHQRLKKDTSYNSCFFSKPIVFDYDTFSHIDFGGVIFSNYTDFQGDLFLGTASFGNACFLKYSMPPPPPVTEAMNVFVSSTFKSTALFLQVYFYNPVLFDGTKFEKDAEFYLSTFYDEAVFSPTYFHNVTFFELNFMGEVKFNNSLFNGKTIFQICYFSKGLNFTSAIFTHRVVFDSVHFKDSCQVSFKNAILPDTLCFINTPSFKNEINLINANFKDSNKNNHRKINLYLFNTDITKFHLDYIHFKLLFINPENHDTVSNDERKAIYQTLLKSFKDRGQEDSYEALDKEFQHFLYSKKPDWLARMWGWFLEHWWNFGYNREKIFKWSFFALLIFSCVTFFGLNYFKGEVYKVTVIPDIPKLCMHQTFRSYLKRFWYSFVYTSILFFPLALKLNNLNFKKLGVVYIFIVYITGLICVGFMVNFIIQK